MPAWIGSFSVGVPFANRLAVGRRRKREGDQLRLWDNIRCLITMCLITTASDLVLGCSVVQLRQKAAYFVDAF